jgi:hypothetical protein
VRRRVLALVFACTVLAAAAAGGCAATVPGDLAPVTVVVTGRLMQPEFETAFVPGSVLRVADSGAEIGAIVSVEATPSAVRFLIADGTTVERPSPLLRDYRITLVGTAKAVEGGYLFPGGRLALGKDVLMGTKLISFTGSVTSVRAKGE